MFSSAEFVEEWNQIFSFKIKESDLARPTETFVFNALISYLKMFNFDTAPMIQMKNSENVTERRHFLIRFCQYIDHFYKVSDKSHCFVFYDLMHPSPKKTVHMLNHLLNYFFYYNMFKESVVGVANAKIRERAELVDKINKFKFENQQTEIKAKMIKKTIEEYRAMVPKTSSELKDLIEAEAADKENINTLEEQLTTCNSTLEALQNEEVLLTMEIVSQEEVDRLITSKTTLTNAIAEHEGLESTIYARNQEMSATVVKLQNKISSIDEAMSLNPPSSLAAYKDCNTKCKELESKLAEINHQKESLNNIYEKLQKDMKRTEDELNSKVLLLKEMKIAGEKEIEETKLLAQSNEALIGDLEHELHTVEREKDEEKAVTNYILENAALLVKATVENCGESSAKDSL